ncbi:hypothetical protein L218DRAFT_860954 [Marasmius fiardii PR-910]|nr:hypothetical protein L218DRAFT_860954 [Marasmius fiardii PR-910]
MRLTLSGNFLKCTYTDENGRVIYKVQTTSTIHGKTTISKVLPDDIPRGERIGQDDEINDSGPDRFAHLGRIDWRVGGSILVRGGEELSVKTFFRRGGLWALGKNRLFFGDDGREYKWILGSWTSELQLNDENKTPVAKLIRGNIGGIFGQKRPAVLEIYPAGEHMADLMILTFLYVEKIRRDD